MVIVFRYIFKMTICLYSIEIQCLRVGRAHKFRRFGRIQTRKVILKPLTCTARCVNLTPSTVNRFESRIHRNRVSNIESAPPLLWGLRYQKSFRRRIQRTAVRLPCRHTGRSGRRSRALLPTSKVPGAWGLQACRPTRTWSDGGRGGDPTSADPRRQTKTIVNHRYARAATSPRVVHNWFATFACRPAGPYSNETFLKIPVVSRCWVSVSEKAAPNADVDDACLPPSSTAVQNTLSGG